MRIRTLELTRFGKFPGAVLDFGDAVRGTPDLHVIYGPNEAGKSTTFAAILDLLFGIPTQTPYSFKHPYPTMRIGATLDLLGETRRFIRIKRPQNSLLDSDERPLPEASILAELGGMDRDAYEKMFFLDDATLEKGGEDILASEGELGRLLFSASAGLADLGGKLAGLKTETEAFYKYRSRSGRLGDLKARLSELKAQREAVDFLAAEHRLLVEQRDRLVDAYDWAIAERSATQNRIDEIGRILLAMPRLAELKQLVEEMSQLVPMKPGETRWREELPQLEKKSMEHAAERRRLRENRERIERELKEASADPVALRLSARMGRLAELKARFMTADTDIPKLRARLAEASVDPILLRLGRRDEPDPRSLVLDTMLVGEFTELIEVRSGIDARTKSADDELQKARRLLERAKLASPDAASEEVNDSNTSLFDELAVLIAAHRNTALETKAANAKRGQKQAADLLGEAMRRLAPWQGEPDDLMIDPVPDRTVMSRWVSEFDESRKAAERAESEVPKLEAEIRRLEGEAAALRANIGTAATSDAAQARAIRDKAWADHRAALTGDTADTFEANMRLDDMIAAERASKVADIERLHQLVTRTATTQADLDTALIAKANGDARRNSVLEEISDRFARWAVGSAWRMEPAEMANWLALRDRALEARGNLKEADAAADEVAAELSSVEEYLRRKMRAVGLDAPDDHQLSRLLETAQVAVDDRKQTVALRAELRRLADEVEERNVQFNACVREEAAWSARWQALCDRSWIKTVGQKPGTVAMRQLIAESEELAKVLETQTALADRIGKMEGDQASFRSEVLELCGQMGLPLDFTELELAGMAESAVRDAERNVKRTETAELAMKELEADEVELAQHERDVDLQCRRMMDYFGVKTLEEVQRCIVTAGRRTDLEKRIGEAERRIVETMRVADVLAATATLDGAERDDLLAEETKLKGVLVDQDNRCHELFHQRSNAIDKLDSQGGDGKVAELEGQRRTVLLEIEEQARQYLVLKAGTIAAEHALALYRDRHRSSMMAKASEAFSTISQGTYKGLAVQPGKDGETLIALVREGGSKAANQLSKGARFQLYLALRVAGYHEFVSSRSAVPFIADDIMETFDDFRAEEAFRLFAGMAEKGQVVYMTHHRHLTAIAKEVCPSVRIHDLETFITAIESSQAAE